MYCVQVTEGHVLRLQPIAATPHRSRSPDFLPALLHLPLRSHAYSTTPTGCIMCSIVQPMQGYHGYNSYTVLWQVTNKMYIV